MRERTSGVQRATQPVTEQLMSERASGVQRAAQAVTEQRMSELVPHCVHSSNLKQRRSRFVIVGHK